jgi:hypothetical protein
MRHNHSPYTLRTRIFSTYTDNLAAVRIARNLMYVSYLYLSNCATIDLDNFSYALFSVSQQSRETNLRKDSAAALNGLSGEASAPPPPSIIESA